MSLNIFNVEFTDLQYWQHIHCEVNDPAWWYEVAYSAGCFLRRWREVAGCSHMYALQRSAECSHQVHGRYFPCLWSSECRFNHADTVVRRKIFPFLFKGLTFFSWLGSYNGIISFILQAFLQESPADKWHPWRYYQNMIHPVSSTWNRSFWHGCLGFKVVLLTGLVHYSPGWELCKALPVITLRDVYDTLLLKL